MIILKNTKNTQTFYVSKKCGIEPGQLPVGSYTKIEADERFQPKGNYISEEKAEELIDTKVTESIEDQVPPLVDQSIDAKLAPINTEITNLKGEVQELETSKKEELTAVENKIPDVSGLATKDQVALKADKSELSNYVTTDTYNAKMTELDGEISAIQAQIGNISTTLDTINGEIPNE